ncbi:unnamed protein product [Notodromas monacha]|uniref:Solute carrier family 25 member 51 n=1 Tax=Notodromas monacha TaxID=399045 RepID=A0A7R9BNS3_9CRUS|nr:unnamed protein product [Notodromas monacha]CAG0918588.1 unnamed protein product [Notodromas monacha]
MFSGLGRLVECSGQTAKSSSSSSTAAVQRGDGSRRPLRDAVDWRQYAAGWGAAFVNITVTFPLNKIMFRQMLHGVEMKRAVRMLRKEGILHLYRGLPPPLFMKTLSGSIMWGMFHTSQRFLETHPVYGLGPNSREVIAALAAGSCEAILTPFERVQVLMQDKRYHHKFRNTMGAFRSLWRFGIKEYYRGAVPILLRNGPSNCLFFRLRRETKDAFSPLATWYGNLVFDFLNGAVIGAFISTLFYPVNVVKTRIQARVGGRFRGIVETFVEIYRERGVKMYYGVHLNYTRALVSWGIINASYEVFKNLLGADN